MGAAGPPASPWPCGPTPLFFMKTQSNSYPESTQQKTCHNSELIFRNQRRRMPDTFKLHHPGMRTALSHGVGRLGAQQIRKHTAHHQRLSLDVVVKLPECGFVLLRGLLVSQFERHRNRRVVMQSPLAVSRG